MNMCGSRLGMSGQLVPDISAVLLKHLEAVEAPVQRRPWRPATSRRGWRDRRRRQQYLDWRWAWTSMTPVVQERGSVPLACWAAILARTGNLMPEGSWSLCDAANHDFIRRRPESSDAVGGRLA